jgi:hypothetical protein
VSLIPISSHLSIRHQKKRTPPKKMTESTWAIYQRFDGTPTRVKYSHLTEQEAQDEANRLNDQLDRWGLPGCLWIEQHHPSAVFVIG